MHATNVGKWDISRGIASMMVINHQTAGKNRMETFDSYDPVVGKWMTNLVAITPITAKAMKSLYAELNRQKDLKRTYRRRYQDLQAVVATTTNTPATTSHPTIVTSSRGHPKCTNNQKHLQHDNKRGFPDKGKAKPIGKVKKNPIKTTPNTTLGPSVNLCSQLKDKAKHTATLITGNYQRTPSNRRGIFERRSRFRCHPGE